MKRLVSLAWMSLFGVALAGGCDSSCEDGAYRCAGTVLQQCSAGEYASIEDCGEGRCMAAFGSCEGEGGSAGAQGSGGAQGGGGAAGAAGMSAAGSGGAGGSAGAGGA
jgi:hypothetical protein